MNEARGNGRLPGIMTLGYISAFSETLALAVIVAKGVPPLVDALVRCQHYLRAITNMPYLVWHN